MSRILWRPRFRDGAFSLGSGLMILSLLLLPKQSISAAGDGVQLCLNVILPSLFPFFVLSTLCVDSGIIRALERFYWASSGAILLVREPPSPCTNPVSAAGTKPSGF